MSPQANDNTPNAVIKRVRRRNNMLHVTYSDGRLVSVPQAVNNRYTSRVSYGYDQQAGTYDAQAVTS